MDTSNYPVINRPRVAGAFGHKIDYFTILNLNGHPNCSTGPRVRAILLIGWILPIGEASAVEGMRSMGLPRLVN